MKKAPMTATERTRRYREKLKAKRPPKVKKIPISISIIDDSLEKIDGLTIGSSSRSQTINELILLGLDALDRISSKSTALNTPYFPRLSNKPTVFEVAQFATIFAEKLNDPDVSAEDIRKGIQTSEGIEVFNLVSDNLNHCQKAIDELERD